MKFPCYPYKFYKFGESKITAEMDDLTIQTWVQEVVCELEKGEPFYNISSGNAAVIGLRYEDGTYDVYVAKNYEKWYSLEDV